jgi:hypothetical protein
MGGHAQAPPCQGRECGGAEGRKVGNMEEGKYEGWKMRRVEDAKGGRCEKENHSNFSDNTNLVQVHTSSHRPDTTENRRGAFGALREQPTATSQRLQQTAQAKASSQQTRKKHPVQNTPAQPSKGQQKTRLREASAVHRDREGWHSYHGNRRVNPLTRSFSDNQGSKIQGYRFKDLSVKKRNPGGGNRRGNRNRRCG